MKISIKEILFSLFVAVFVYVAFVYVAFRWAVAYNVNKQCGNQYDARNTTYDYTGPITPDDYSEEERQIYATALGFCVADIKEEYDGEEFDMVVACQYVAKDIVRVVFNPGYLSREYTLHDVYEDAKSRVITASLNHGDIRKK